MRLIEQTSQQQEHTEVQPTEDFMLTDKPRKPKKIKPVSKLVESDTSWQDLPPNLGWTIYPYEISDDDEPVPHCGTQNDDDFWA